MNTRILLATALIGLFAVAPAQAGHGHYTDRAKVVAVDPIYRVERVPVERRECWEEPEIRRGHVVAPRDGAVAGAVVGGVIGHQVGHGPDRGVATAAGAVLGAVAGHSLARHSDEYEYRTTHRECERVRDYHEERRLVGYDVTYRYRGETITRRMDHNPGRWVEVEVAVRPVR